ncbi:MAG TPA: polysaccharide deacetylase [Candidatus Dormibacteraeota bacterium]|jgi:peptidoglycan/xylan/chitin deacetylase (PgdA/CDA1 family)|nr:polysaccharide deacetylase [Candidatus Dormibacteraeota bacterium]
MHWPRDARAACAFTFDLDAETLWMARGVHEPVTLSQGRFGPVEALPRILALLRANEIRATFFIPAWVAEHHSDAVRAIVAGGHEIGCHGDEHERVSELPPDREEAILTRSVEVLSRIGGARPIGYRAPAWQLSSETLSLLGRYEFAYSSNMMDRLEPYLHPPAGGRALVEIPVSWVLDDAPYFMFTGQRSIQPPGPVLQGWITEFEGITEARGVTNFTFHPQIIGRPSRLACLRELIDHVRHTPRIWLASLAEINEHYRTTVAGGAAAGRS